MKGKRIIIPIFLAVMITAAAVPSVKASANSAAKEWYGRDSLGVYCTGDFVPVEVEREKLTLRIPDFPQEGYDSYEEILKYEANVTAEYTFYNPEAYDVNLTLVFPFGERPSYLFYRDEEGWGQSFDDTARYSITADGAPIERKLRYTYEGYSHYFDAEAGLAKLEEGRKSAVYYESAPVTRYTYSYSGTAVASLQHYSMIEADFTGLARSGRTRVFLSDDDSYYGYAHGNTQGVGFYNDSGTFSIYVVGDELSALPAWKSQGGSSGTIKFESKEDGFTFADLAYAGYGEESGISRSDWYNAVFDGIIEGEKGGMATGLNTSVFMPERLMRWYEYTLQIPAGGRIVNSVTAPLYPKIDGDYKTPIYSYTYLLSPARCWADFGTFEAELHTPYCILDASVDFSKGENGVYTYTQRGLPAGELDIILSESPDPKPVFGSRGIMIYFVIFLFIGLPVLILIGGLIALIVLLTCKRKTQK